MMMITLFVIGFIIGIVLGLVKLIVGDTAYYVLSTLAGFYFLYIYFNFFGLAWGMFIIIAFVVLLIIGFIEIGKDVWGFITGIFD